MKSYTDAAISETNNVKSGGS